MGRRKILFANKDEGSWLDRDRLILEQAFEVEHLPLRGRWAGLFPPVQTILRNEAVFLWFGSLHFVPLVYFAKLFKKPVVIVAGGFDVAYAPSVNYGALTQNKVSIWFRKWLFRKADKVVCVSVANAQDAMKNIGVPGEKIMMIYHGFEALPENIKLKSWSERKNQVVLITQARRETYFRKGVDQFLKLAKIVPNYRFLLMGYIDPQIKTQIEKEAPENFEMLGILPFRSEMFNNILNESKFIAQLSVHESFGCAVVDGAIMGCTPLVYGQFALRELVDGLVPCAPYGRVDQVKEIMNAVEANPLDPKTVSQFLLNKFPIQARAKALIDAVYSVLPRGAIGQ